MDPLLSEMWLVDSAHALQFFKASLGEVSGACGSRDEFDYVAGTLAHYAQVASGSTDHLPLPGTLRDLHDLFVTDVATWGDPFLMETAAGQALMLTGFFAGGMRLRHSLHTYEQWGRVFYSRAAAGNTGRKQTVLEGMSRHFPEWRHHLERLHVQLWENSHLLAVRPPQATAAVPQRRPGPSDGELPGWMPFAA